MEDESSRLREQCTKPAGPKLAVQLEIKPKLASYSQFWKRMIKEIICLISYISHLTLQSDVIGDCSNPKKTAVFSHWKYWLVNSWRNLFSGSWPAFFKKWKNKTETIGVSQRVRYRFLKCLFSWKCMHMYSVCSCVCHDVKRISHYRSNGQKSVKIAVLKRLNLASSFKPLPSDPLSPPCLSLWLEVKLSRSLVGRESGARKGAQVFQTLP